MSLPTPTLSTDRMTLRPFTDADLGPLYELQSDASVLRYWDSLPWTDPERARVFLDTCRTLEADGTGARVVMESREDGAFLGWLSLSRWNRTHRAASLGYCLRRVCWGRGLMPEAARAVLTWGFQTLDLNRVQAETDTRNLASARVLEKLGFQHEGTLREDCVVDGVPTDSWVFGLLRADWEAQAGAERPC